MTEKTLRKYIHRLNQGLNLVGVFRRRLSSVVDYTFIWEKLPDPHKKYRPAPRPNCFYFIKNEQGLYVAVVLDMENDLHSYVLPEQRGNGYLGKALSTTILPHLFTKRDTIRTTVDFEMLKPKIAKRSEHVTRQLGFALIGSEGPKKVFELHREGFSGPAMDELPAPYVPVQTIDELVYPFYHAAHLLAFVQTQFEAAAGINPQSEALRKITDQLETLGQRIYRYEGAKTD